MNLLERLRNPDCARVRKVLQAFLDGELDERHAGMVAAHLEHCERCGIEADVYQQVKTELRQLRADPDPAAMRRLRQFAADISTSEPGPEPSE